MAITGTITKSFTATGSSLSGSYTVSGGLLQEYSEAVVPDQTDTLMAAEIDVSQLQGWIMKCDTGVTVEWNNGAGADGSISLTADRPVMWDNVDGSTNPLGSTDITAFYVTEDDSGAGTLEMMFLIDPTV